MYFKIIIMIGSKLQERSQKHNVGSGVLLIPEALPLPLKQSRPWKKNPDIASNILSCLCSESLSQVQTPLYVVLE
jgi:hypothetical protein